MVKPLSLASLAAATAYVLAQPGEKIVINAAGQPYLNDDTKEKEPFNPKDFSKRKVQCFAWDRSTDPWTENLIDITWVDLNPEAERALLLVHGWPGLWSTWSNQIEEFRDEYRLLVPDLRGFGWSSHPGDPENSGTIQDHVGDLVCLLEAAGVKRAVCVGHDWGAQICWQAARQRPDIFEAVAGTLPYLPSNGPFTPMENFAAVFPKLAYQIYFAKKTKDAAEELDKDARKTLRAVYRSVATKPPTKFLKSRDDFLEAYAQVGLDDRIPYLSQIEEDYLVKVYGVQGFKNTLSFYTDGGRYRSWEFAYNQGNHTIPQPALFIQPSADSVADWGQVSEIVGSAKFIPQLETVIIHSSHWPQLERPQEFNAALRAWVNKLPPVGTVNYTSEAAEEAAGKEVEEEHRHPKVHPEGKIVDLDDKVHERAQSRGEVHEEL
ncbi:Alpha/beta fold hydrolase [Ceratobasidium theobromae]|uniref:Alpha/beta fold hydrolase n=1 Tax=Ceratobasidium theobromae TaxID=1582974 RepID=A0A5N5QKE3_9AGAM|nr:Alpha/beta fold hydrolase [Ceratobasidium theobromae]